MGTLLAENARLSGLVQGAPQLARELERQQQVGMGWTMYSVRQPGWVRRGSRAGGGGGRGHILERRGAAQHSTGVARLPSAGGYSPVRAAPVAGHLQWCCGAQQGSLGFSSVPYAVCVSGTARFPVTLRCVPAQQGPLPAATQWDRGRMLRPASATGRQGAHPIQCTNVRTPQPPCPTHVVVLGCAGPARLHHSLHPSGWRRSTRRCRRASAPPRRSCGSTLRRWPASTATCGRSWRRRRQRR